MGGVGDFGAPKTGYIVVSSLRTQYKVLTKILLFDFESFSRNSPQTLIEGEALLFTQGSEECRFLTLYYKANVSLSTLFCFRPTDVMLNEISTSYKSFHA